MTILWIAHLTSGTISLTFLTPYRQPINTDYQTCAPWASHRNIETHTCVPASLAVLHTRSTCIITLLEEESLLAGKTQFVTVTARTVLHLAGLDTGSVRVGVCRKTRVTFIGFVEGAFKTVSNRGSTNEDTLVIFQFVTFNTHKTFKLCALLTIFMLDRARSTSLA